MNAFTDAQTAPIVYDEPSKFPPIDYDISVVVPEKLFFEDLSKCWIGKGEGILKGTKLLIPTIQTQYTVSQSDLNFISRKNSCIG